MAVLLSCLVWWLFVLCILFFRKFKCILSSILFFSLCCVTGVATGSDFEKKAAEVEVFIENGNNVHLCARLPGTLFRLKLFFELLGDVLRDKGHNLFDLSADELYDSPSDGSENLVDENFTDSRLVKLWIDLKFFLFRVSKEVDALAKQRELEEAKRYKRLVLWFASVSVANAVVLSSCCKSLSNKNLDAIKSD